MDRHWFLTNTTYGTWLPGDARGFVGRVWEHRPLDSPNALRVEHDLPGTPYDEDIPGLERESADRMNGTPIHLELVHAITILSQFRETAEFRKWNILAVSIMFNHFHVVVGVHGDPKPGKILGDFKAWASKTLNEQYGIPLSKTWWTTNGSKRKCTTEASVRAAIEYTLYKQPNALLTWSPETGVHYGLQPRYTIDDR